MSQNQQKLLTAVLVLLPYSLETASSAVRYVLRNGLFFQHQAEQKKLYFIYQKKASNLDKEQCAVLAFLLSAVRVREEHRSGLDASAENSVLVVERRKEKLNWLKDHSAVICELREKGHSYRTIRMILEYRFRISISHTYISEFFRKHTRSGGSACNKKS